MLQQYSSIKTSVKESLCELDQDEVARACKFFLSRLKVCLKGRWNSFENKQNQNIFVYDIQTQQHILNKILVWLYAFLAQELHLNFIQIFEAPCIYDWKSIQWHFPSQYGENNFVIRQVYFILRWRFSVRLEIGQKTVVGPQLL